MYPFTLNQKNFNILISPIEKIMKTLKPIITLILLVTLLVFAIRNQNTMIEIINNLLYHDERLQMNTNPKHH
jgi:hypothetical protein